MDVILIDGNSIGHASHRSTTLTYGGLQTQAVFGFLRTLRDLKSKNPGAQILVLWDGHAAHRYEMFPGYKGDREKKRQDPKEAASYEAYSKQKPIIYKMIELLGVRQLRHPKLEADDIAGMLVRRLKGKKILLVTGDGDWLQLVSPDVSWFDPRNDGRSVTIETLYEFTGFASPRAFLEGKAIQGDSSDSIPNVAGLGEKGAVSLIARYGSVDGMLAECSNGHIPDMPRHWKKFKEFADSQEEQARFHLNMRLMNLMDDVIPEGIGEVTVTKGEFKADSLKTLFARLGFVSILSDFSSFTEPFTPKTQP